MVTSCKTNLLKSEKQTPKSPSAVSNVARNKNLDQFSLFEGPLKNIDYSSIRYLDLETANLLSLFD